MACYVPLYYIILDMKPKPLIFRFFSICADSRKKNRITFTFNRFLAVFHAKRPYFQAILFVRIQTKMTQETKKQ